MWLVLSWLYLNFHIIHVVYLLIFYKLGSQALRGAKVYDSLQQRHHERDGIPNHQPHDCLLDLLFRHRSKKTSNLRVIGLCEGNSTVTGEFTTQRFSNAESVSIWWRHHVLQCQWIQLSFKGTGKTGLPFTTTKHNTGPVHSLHIRSVCLSWQISSPSQGNTSINK